MLLTENQLDEWVRGNAREAQGVIVELVCRLVSASAPKPKERRFPLRDSIGQSGPDGILDTDFSFEPFVPDEMSFWEIGTGIDPAVKATSDFKNLTTNAATAKPQEVRQQSTFVFVTPLSGRRGWKQSSQQKWIETRCKRNDWKSVRVIDGTKLIDWLHHFPSVELWLAVEMGFPAQYIETPEQRWGLLRTIGDPPPLTPQVFLSNRDAACAKLKEVFAGTALQLKVDTHFPDQVVDFVSAYVAGMDEETRLDAVGRCVVISNTDAWNAITALRERHILIADSDLDLSGPVGTKLLEKARRADHAVIFGGMPGGIPHPNCESIPNPKGYQLKEALEKGGYTEERARILAQKSGGNLGSLLRCLQNLSLLPEWAEDTPAAELAIAELLGAWSEKSEADRAVVEAISKKEYGEWIETMRKVTLRPGTPLIQRDGVWKFVVRYEGWYALGPRIFDDQLERLRQTAVTVLQEQDPKFDLSSDERYAASLHGKVFLHSHQLRNGIAETLSLLGSHPKALTSCSLGKAETTAVLAVREILSGANWLLWASLNDLLPLLAEAAPDEFLDAVELALNSAPCPFDEVFAQEGSGIMGANYTTGLLWALETLAWDTAYLTRVVVILGELATRDPGGNWANRPANSLTTILLPWLPQTCAPVEKRKTAVATLMGELPDVAWKLLLTLLPSSHQTSSGTRKPEWRELIADDWSKGVTHREYWEQIALYAELAISAAKNDLSKLAALIDRLEDLPPPAYDQVLAHLASDKIAGLPESDKFRLWTELVDLIAKNRKYADAEWAMKSEQVDRLAVIADRLLPDTLTFRYQRLFTERDSDLYEEKGNWEEQRNKLEERRQKAVDEIVAIGGVQAVLDFDKPVRSPWRVGIAFGFVGNNDADRTILPDLLESDQKSLAQFAGGFVWGRFRSRGWSWVDNIDTSQWLPTQIGQLLAYLPFTHDTWERSAQLLKQNEAPYWSKTTANPYEADNGLELAIDHLIEHDRPHAALRCLHKLQHDKHPFDSVRATRALLAAIGSSESAHAMDTYEITEIIKALQESPNTHPDELFKVEWAYLSILDGRHGATPKLLGQKLANEPGFFCEVIRLVFMPKNEERSKEEVTEEKKNIATNAYRLLSKWRIQPGCHEDGTYDGHALITWLDAVKKECTDTGHLEMAMTIVGQAFIHMPADPDGLWIHRAAAAALNAKDAGEMREGFQTELYNKRGAQWVDPTGKPERELAKKYQAQAEVVEGAGYHRLATTLRELAESYVREAERVSSRDRSDV